METLEDTVLLIARYADAGIPYRDVDEISRCIKHRNADTAARLGKLDGIVQQFDQYLACPVGVGLNKTPAGQVSSEISRSASSARTAT